MTDNEDSVVTSLNELRKLKHERITRQTQSRAVVGSGYAAALAEDPASEQLTPPPMQMSEFSSVGQYSRSGRRGAGLAVAAAPHVGFAQPIPGYDHYPVQAAPVSKTSYTAAVVMSVLLIGGGAAGYVKLQNDTQAVLAAKDASIRQAEEARNKAVELAAKSDQQSRTNLRQCEDKLKSTLAVAPATPAPAAALVEKKMEKPAAVAKVASRAARHKPAAHPARRTALAEPAAPKPADVPNIPKKKKVDNDPLAGLGKF
ncbi:MAG TPA: hypothetical protein VF524_03275 [Polyangia bacterium]